MNVVRELNNFASLFKKKLLLLYETELIPQVKEMIKDNYNEKLMGIVPEGSLGRPEDFYDQFMEKLNEFQFLKEDGANSEFNIPDRETFNFGQDLSFLQHVMEGMTGFYYLIPIGTYRLLGYTPPDLRQSLYLVREDDPLMDDVRRILGDTFLEPYAFSNSPPINVFEGVEEYVDSVHEDFIERALAEAKNEFSNRGA